MESRKVLAYLAIKFRGNRSKIFHAIRFKEEMNVEEIENCLSECKTDYITLLDEDYPIELKNIHRPPIVLFYKGDKSLLNSKKVLAIVGSRHCSDYAKFATKQIIHELNEDIVIVSGLAKGVDTIALEACLQEGKKPIAFLGCGIDYIYPNENYSLYKDIEEHGLLISEYPGYTPPSKEYFPIRNRLIAGISRGVLVIEGKTKSGTATTVNHAAAFNKDIYAIPHPITIENDSICNDLIRDGAIIVRNANDINEDF